MNNLFILTFLSLTILACGQQKEQNPEQNLKQLAMSTNNKHSKSDPENVIKSLMAAMEANDAEKIRSLFHDNASQAYGDGPR